MSALVSDWPLLLALAAGWESVYQLSGFILRKVAPGNEKLGALGGSYATALLHSVIVTYRGFLHMATYWHAPEKHRMLLLDGVAPYDEVGRDVEFTSRIFLSWLLYDIFHVFALYPKLGKWDTVAHHLAFIACSVLACSYRMLPFAFCWFLINTGNGDTAAMNITNITFALSFFAARVLLYGIGLVDLLIHREIILSSPQIPLLVSQSLLVLIVAGYLLNLMWMWFIVNMAMGKGRNNKKKAS